MRNRSGTFAAFSVLAMAAAPGYAQTPAPSVTPPAAAPTRPATPSNEITVTGTRPGVTTSIDSRAYLIDRDLGASTGTLADALRNVPSVQVDLEGNLSLRGDQGVQILVDGKPSPLFVGEGRKQSLLNFPAKDIERVEVMTTPSAAYSPEGSGGIINIITKNPGASITTASVTAQYGSAGATKFSGSYSRKAGKLTVTGSVNKNNDVYKGGGTSSRTAQPNPAAAPLDSALDWVWTDRNRSQSGNLNLTYDATPKWQMAANVSGNRFRSSHQEFDRYSSSIAGAPASAYTKYETTPRFTNSSTGFGATVTRKFDGPEHDLTANYNFNRAARAFLLQGAITQTLPATPFRIEQSFSNRITRQNRIRLNYRGVPSEGTKLALGYELQDDDQDFDNFFARGPSAASLVVDPNVSNPFAYQGQIHSVFGTYERPIGAFSAQYGLRVELTDLKIGPTVERDYARAYPTLNFGYKFDDNNSLRGGYSRRVQRPAPQQLNPFRTQYSNLFFSEGNPNLGPQETDSFEVGYQFKQGQTSYLATLYWRVANNEFTFVTRDLGGGVSLTTTENLGRSRSGGLEFVANGRLSSTLKYSLSTNAFWKEIAADNLGIAGARSALGVSGNANLNWDATAKDALQLNAVATGKGLSAQGYFAPFATMNLGWRHKFDNRVAATLTLRDVFDTTRFKFVTDTPTLRGVQHARQQARAAWLQLTYNFGAGRAADPAFDYGAGGGGGAGN
jgi:outer membrane receptor protein involved in Fe transport